MKITGWVTKRVEETVDVICDRCNKSTKVPAGTGQRINHETGKLGELEQFFEPYYETIRSEGGYSSPFLDDGSVATAHLCEGCWLEARKALEGIGVKFTDTNYIWDGLEDANRIIGQ